MGRAAVPSGASTGAHEAVELRDGDKSRWGGKGVDKAVRGGQRRDRRHRSSAIEAEDQAEIDAAMIDARRHATTRAGSAPTRSSASAWRWPRRRRTRAACRSTAMSAGSRSNLLPVPMMNILNGGAHADNPIDFQEFMVMPVGAPTFSEALRCGAEIFHALKSGAAPGGPVDRGRRRRRLRAQHRLGPRGARLHRRGGRARPATSRASDVLIALDCAATEYFKDGTYEMTGEGRSLTPDENGRLSSPSSPPTIRSPRSRTAWPRTTWPGGRR